MAAENDIDLDSIIDRLLEVRGNRPGKQVQLMEQEIRFLCTKAREIFISQPILLELEAPIKVRVPQPYISACLAKNLGCHRSAATSMDSTTISSVCLNMAASPPKQTTSS
jgi:hypothetical protein